MAHKRLVLGRYRVNTVVLHHNRDIVLIIGKNLKEYKIRYLSDKYEQWINMRSFDEESEPATKQEQILYGQI